MNLGDSRLRWTSRITTRQVPWRADKARVRAREGARLNALWFELKQVGLAPTEHTDILHVALEELNTKLAGPEREDVLVRLLFKLFDTFELGDRP